MRIRTHQPGFTLIELLVVISIIVLLLGIGVAGMSKLYTQAGIEQTDVLLNKLLDCETELRVQLGNQILSDDVATLRTQWGNTDIDSANEGFILACRQFEATKTMIESMPERNLIDSDGDGLDEAADSWGVQIRYRTSSDGSVLPKYHRPFFASGGADQDFGTSPTDAKSKDNRYSYQVE